MDGSVIWGIENGTQGHTRNFEIFRAIQEITEFHIAIQIIFCRQNDATNQYKPVQPIEPVRLTGLYRCWFVKKYCRLVCVREK